MRLVYAVPILLALMTSAQCQQTAEDWYNQGNVLTNQSKYDEAIKAFDEAIRLNPNDANAWFGKGIALQGLGNTTEADAAIAKAQELGFTG